MAVRPARPEDADLIVEMNLAMAKETEDKPLDRAALDRGVRRALGDPMRASYLVDEEGGVLRGCLMITREWSDWRDGYFLWIQSVYVAPAHRRKGVYRALHGAVVARAKAEFDVVGIRLYVERDNEGAQQTYRVMGMSETPYRLFEELI